MKTAIIGYPRTLQELKLATEKYFEGVLSKVELRDTAVLLNVMLEKPPKEKLWVNPDCGLKMRGNAETVPSLLNMIDAAQEGRRSLEL